MQKVSYTGDGSTTEFAFNFPYYEDTNIIVTKNNQTATGYSIIGTSGGLDADIPYTGGKVVFDTAPTILDTITIARYLPRTRSVDYQPLAKIDPTTLNQDMNYMMEVLKDMQDDLTTFQTQYESIVNKPETTQLLNKIDNVTEEMEETNQTITDFYTDIQNGRLMSKDDFYSYTTNCITKIPMDIKLELSNGTITLKKGSKIYIPNGTGVFDTIDITSDKTTTINTNGQYYIVLNPTDGYLNRGNYPASSGTSAPATPNTADLWYDTTNNLVKRYSSGTWSKMSFPIAIVTVSNGAISSIDQVFNGFGYIGSTIFALPGVEGLIPNGRNDDGTLKNAPASSITVHIYTSTSAFNGVIGMSASGEITCYTNLSYDSDNNYNYQSGARYGRLHAGTAIFGSGGQITSFEPKKVFNLL